jgi:hypothetical protein
MKMNSPGLCWSCVLPAQSITQSSGHSVLLCTTDGEPCTGTHTTSTHHCAYLSFIENGASYVMRWQLLPLHGPSMQASSIDVLST